MLFKLKLIAPFFLIFLFGFKNIDKSYILEKDRLLIPLKEGMLHIIPITENSIRIQLRAENTKELQELILIENLAVPVFKVASINSKDHFLR
ncbi:hypothetical protein N4T20_18420 [Flavobacterium sp. TR2]|uniref:hypothetical protein n=1 Tax=Flavobacterium sp. TR2 TaxID=2977321 RepID=UPI0021B0FA19|nr:hypothetical protein [Flavobacterium sp. TR2]UWY27693.1 hypothetical protein N4T20_18420 [Flavobacterium sp. TR2]